MRRCSSYRRRKGCTSEWLLLWDNDNAHVRAEECSLSSCASCQHQAGPLLKPFRVKFRACHSHSHATRKKPDDRVGLLGFFIGLLMMGAEGEAKMIRTPGSRWEWLLGRVALLLEVINQSSAQAVLGQQQELDERSWLLRPWCFQNPIHAFKRWAGKFLSGPAVKTVLPMGFPGGSAGKESTCHEGDLGLIPGLGRSPAEEKGYPLRYSGLENFMDYVVHGVAKSRTWLSN